MARWTSFARKGLCPLVAMLILFLYFSQSVAASGEIVYRYASETESPRVALTFDDGPHPRYTPIILDILAEQGIKATFFVVGENAEYHPELIKRIAAEGHELGNHTFDHCRVAKMGDYELKRDILRCSDTVFSICGQRPRLFRPPEGVCNRAVKTVCTDADMTIVMWSVDTRDWAHTPVEEIYRNVRSNTKNGSIILMHDFIGKNSPTPAALRQMLPMLQELGYEFVTVSQLLEAGQA